MEHNYHLFRKTVKSGKKEVKKWYYYFFDEEGNRYQRVCKNCRTLEEATSFIKELEFNSSHPLTVAEVAKGLFEPDSDYINRQIALGKKLSEKTLKCYRSYTGLIIDKFGDIPIEKLKSKNVTNYLMTLDKSGSWKNSYCEVLSKIYDEAIWQTNGAIQKPSFLRFARNSKKADVFSRRELSDFLNETLWTNKEFYLFFLCTATCGLRLGETRALRKKQFLFDKNVLVVDGFCKQNGERTNYNKKGSDEDSKMRVVILPTTTSLLMKQFIEKKSLLDDDFIFTKDDKPIRQEFLESIFKSQLLKSGIEKDGRKLVPHSLRFTYVTLMRKNLDAETVQKLVGHSSVEMTDYYTRIAIPEMAESLQGAKPIADNLLDVLH